MSTTPMRRMPTALLYALFFLSGCTGLVYEVVWTRDLIFVLGGTTYAITTVVVAFMSGLALGSFCAGRLAGRLKQPGRAYGKLEITIGLYALLVPVLLASAEPLYRGLYLRVGDTPGILTAVRFLLSSLVLVLPTTCMGATLPILVRYVTLRGHAFGRTVGLLYGINTLGAVLGTSAAGFLLLPSLGLTWSPRLAAAANLLIGVVSLVFMGDAPALVPTAQKAGPRSTKASRQEPALAVPSGTRRVVILAFAASGFAAMVYQICWTRALILSVGSSTYAFTCILAAFILGLALGSLAIARWVDRWRQPVAVFGLLELGIGLSAAVVVPIHGYVPVIVRGLVTQYCHTYNLLLAHQFILIMAITCVPTLLMGAVFPLVTRILASAHQESAEAVGNAYAVNTVGTILGAFLAGFVLIRSEVLGVQHSIAAAALLNAGAGMWLLLKSAPSAAAIRKRLLVAVPLTAAIPLAAVAAGQWDRHLLISAPYLRDRKFSRGTEEILYFREGVDVTAVVAKVTEGSRAALRLDINGKPDASTTFTDMTPMVLMGHLPALLCENGKRACVIGLGAGMTLGALASHPSFQSIDCIEISDEVIQAAEYFNDYTDNVMKKAPRVNIIRADGRNHLLLTDRTYDLIVSQPSNPWVTGEANLFTRDFLRLCKDRLADDGLLCVWLQGYSISAEQFKIVVRTLFDVFEFVSLWEPKAGDYIMIAGRRPFAVPLDHVLARFNQPAVRADLYRLAMNSLGRVMGLMLTSGEPLRKWVANARVNTDDNALVEFMSPRNLYLPDRELVDLETSLLALQRAPLDQVVVAREDLEAHRAFRQQVEATANARRWLNEGRQCGERMDVEGALSDSLKAYDSDPGNLEVMEQLGQIRAALLANPSVVAGSPAVAKLLERINTLPRFPWAPPTGASLSSIARQLESLAVTRLAHSDLSLAASYLKEAVDIDPENRSLLQQMVKRVFDGGGLKDAAGLLDEALSQNPNGGRLHYLRAGCAAQSGDADAAIKHLESAIRLREIDVDQARQDIMLLPIKNDARLNGLANGSR
jgi:spermidine synthase